MNVSVRIKRMSVEEFFDWAQAREERYEFDGFQPVAMKGGTLEHNWAPARDAGLGSAGQTRRPRRTTHATS